MGDMKKLATNSAIVLTLFGIFAVAASANFRSLIRHARAPDSQPHPKVAVLIPGGVSFFTAQKKHLEAAARDRGINLVFFDAGWDPQVQAEQIEQAQSMGMGAVALCAVDNLAAQVAVKRLEGLPVVTFTNSIGDDRHGTAVGVTCHVGRDEVTSGHMLGEQIERLGIKAPKIALVQGAPGTTPQRLRLKGFQEVLKEHADWEVVFDVSVPGWSTERVEDSLSTLLQSKRPVDVICSQWADAAVVAARLLEAFKRPEIKQVTLEYTQGLRREMLLGRVSSTTHFSLRNEGSQLVDILQRVLQKKPVPEFVEMPQELLLPSQAEQMEAGW